MRRDSRCAFVGVHAGTLRAVVEDVLYVRLKVARPTDARTELRVVERYASMVLSTETTVSAPRVHDV